MPKARIIYKKISHENLQDEEFMDRLKLNMQQRWCLMKLPKTTLNKEMPFLN